jgi:hypothetical protein
MEMSNTQAIKVYFEKDGGRTVTLQEMKELTRDDRQELGALAAKELGAEIKAPA